VIIIDAQKTATINTFRLSRLSPLNIVVIIVLKDMPGSEIVIPLITFYARKFKAGATGMGVLIANFSVMQFILSSILGRRSDRIGRRAR
jgi:MFS family permease